MESRAILESALFQLMSTRTRFDLVLFCGSKKEKFASGIFEPFVSHLIFARDQISKGGYSISLHPPNSHSSWFTKSTFDRFVKFVNTPAITERFATLEKEILQIEHSIQANEIANAEQIQDDMHFAELGRFSNGSFAGAQDVETAELCYRMQKNISLRLTNEQISPGAWYVGLFNGIGVTRTQGKMIVRTSAFSFSANISVEGCKTATMWGPSCNQTIYPLSCSRFVIRDHG